MAAPPPPVDRQGPHFDISAAVVRQLGDELVTDEVTAIVELVKNAYDADATYAHVVVDTAARMSGQQSSFPDALGLISIEDDGMGMTRAEIEKGWLVISLSTKRSMKAKGERTPRGRTPLGDKGLGRLSTQKLGSNLEIFTRKDEAPDTVHVSFSWDAFTEDKSLSGVPVAIAPAPHECVRKKGTKLVISNLRDPDAWRGAAAEKLVTDLSQLISPFPDARPFTITLRIDGRSIDLGSISAGVRNAALARFIIDYKDRTLNLSGKVRLAKFRGNLRDDDLEFFENVVIPTNGREFFEFLETQNPPVKIRHSSDATYFVEFDQKISIEALGGISKNKAAEADRELEAPELDPGPFHGEIDEFSLRGDEFGLRLSGLQHKSDIQNLVKQHAGIKVFRDGFGVKPYGLNGEDWLRLGAQQTSASSWYGLRPQNIVGFVSISESTNGQLKEKTDREGFVANGYYRNFYALLKYCTETIETFYEWIRRNYTKYRLEKAKGTRALETGRKIIASASSTAKSASNYAERAKRLNEAAGTVSQQMKAVSARIANEPLLASSEERRLANLLAEASAALDAAQTLAKDLTTYAADAEAVSQMVSTIAPRLDLLNLQLTDFSELAGLGLLAETLSHEVLNQTDRLSQKSSTASQKGQKSQPKNLDLIVYAQDVLSISSALRRQIGHLGPSLRFQRDAIEKFAVSGVIQDSVDIFSERLRDAGIAFLTEPSSTDFSVKTNRGRLSQVLDNLILNSIYWLRENGTQKKSISANYTKPLLQIWDSGRGVDPTVEDTLFEPFVTLKPDKKGRGLGLFICSQILESMGCSISLSLQRNEFGNRYIFDVNLAAIADD